MQHITFAKHVSLALVLALLALAMIWRDDTLVAAAPWDLGATALENSNDDKATTTSGEATMLLARDTADSIAATHNEKDFDAGRDLDQRKQEGKAREEREAQHEEELSDGGSEEDGQDDKHKGKDDRGEMDDHADKKDDAAAKPDARNATDHSHVVIPSVDPNLIYDPLLRNLTLTYKHLRNHRPPPQLKSMEAIVSSSSSSSWSSDVLPAIGSKVRHNMSTHTQPPQTKTHMVIDMVPNKAADDVEAFIGALRDYLASLDDDKRKVFEKAYLAHADDDDKYALARAMGVDVTRHVYSGASKEVGRGSHALAPSDDAANASSQVTFGDNSILGTLFPPGLARLLNAIGAAKIQQPEHNDDDDEKQKISSLFSGSSAPLSAGFVGSAVLSTEPPKRSLKRAVEA